MTLEMHAPPPYYEADGITLYLGDALTLWPLWAAADSAVMVTDPPYGQGWEPLTTPSRSRRAAARPLSSAPIAGDADTKTRDGILALWGLNRPAAVFGNLGMAPPPFTRQTLVYRKPPDAGTHGTTAGFRRDLEAVYLLGAWPDDGALGGRSSLLETGARQVGNTIGLAARYGHPHAKPVDVCEDLIRAAPPGQIADPCCGSGSVLIAARNLGRAAVGIEIDERYAERCARRLAQGVIAYPETHG